MSGFRPRNGLLVAVAASLAAAAVSAHEGATGIVAERLQAMEAVAADVKVLSRTLKSESTVTADVRSRVLRIRAQAHDILRLSPPGSNHGNPLARPEGWTQRDEFERLARAYDEAS